jgi:homoserine dehydrogenase
VRTVDVAVTGYGRIGREVARMLQARAAAYRSRHGVHARITGVCGSAAGLIDATGLAPERLADRGGFVPGLTGEAFLDAVRPDVLIEAGPSDYATGGPALGYLRWALAHGLDAIAVSKGALVVDLRGLLHLAGEHGGSLRFSGAAASALPTVDLLAHSLAGATLHGFEAVLTGTTTFVLDQMATAGLGLADAVALAQARGIAEPDPRFDVDGWDTAAKLVIIANAVLDAGLRLEDLPREGIAAVTPGDIARWASEGLTPRLVGFAEHDGGGFRAGVGLRLYGGSHPFAQLRGSMKGLRAVTAEMGTLTVTGGASDPRATAAAALKDFEHLLAERHVSQQ